MKNLNKNKIFVLLYCLSATIPTIAVAADDIYPFLNQGLSKDEKDQLAESVCLTTSGYAISAMKDRQLGKRFETAKAEAISASISEKDSENKNKYYQAIIEEQYRLAYAYPIMPTNQEKYNKIKILRDKELARCGKAFGVQNIGKNYGYIKYYTDLREKP